MTTSETFDAAFREHQGGNLAEAQSLYQRVLSADAWHPDARHLIGVLSYQLGRLDDAEQSILLAIQIAPKADYFANLGLVLSAAGKVEGAIAAYHRAVELRPNFAEAHN